jgi:hypothetical protein
VLLAAAAAAVAAGDDDHEVVGMTMSLSEATVIFLSA